MENEKRNLSYKRNNDLESLLSLVNDYLGPVEDKILDTVGEKVEKPIVFVLGAPRSGTTLLTQWLAKTGLFVYPTNVISRFYRTPYIGLLIQHLLFDKNYAYKDELSDIIPSEITYGSDTGKTSGSMAPSEFWYFWRRFFEFKDVPYSKEEFIKKADFEGFFDEINLMQSFNKLPFMCKGMIINEYASVFAKFYSKVLFINVNRDLRSNIISLYKTRNRYFGNISDWYSFKPRDFHLIKNLKPYEQIACQIMFANHYIQNEMDLINSTDNYINLRYKDFCNKPSHLFEMLKLKLSELDYSFNNACLYDGPESFKVKEYQLSASDNNEINASIDKGYRLLSELG